MMEHGFSFILTRLTTSPHHKNVKNLPQLGDAEVLQVQTIEKDKEKFV